MTAYIELAKNAKNISGMRFGRLLVLGPVGHQDRHIKWECLCDCGNRHAVSGNTLRRGTSHSCGCLQKEITAERNTKHGMTSHPLFNGWQQMNMRCSNPDATGYQNWGGRGITVCGEWQRSFVTFHDYVSALPDYGLPGMTLDRIDNDGDYEPGNLRWATRKQQLENRRPQKKRKAETA